MKSVRNPLARQFNICLSLVLFCFCARTLCAQSSLASRVLVVYLSDDSNSSAVAAYYQSKRGIPASNMCPVSLPSPSVADLSSSDYNSLVKAPVQACLNTAGPQNILYIVLAYVRLYEIDSSFGPYALDSYLSDIWDQYTTQSFNPVPTRNQPYYVDNQSQGNVFVPFESLAAYRALGSLPLIYSVWRLDGATPALATALVDNALAAEAAGGPVSQVQGSNANACIDMELDPTTFPDSAYRAADWDLYRASQFLSDTSLFNVIADTQGTTFGTPPSPDCPNTGLYAGWYNYGTYNNAFSWDPGSIGWDLDSGALFDPRGGVWWGSNALQQGVTVTSGPVTEPYLEGMARPGGVMRNLLEGANVGDAFLRNTRWLKWRILNVGDPLYTPFANKVPPFNAPLPANSLAANPRELVGAGNGSVALTVTLDAPAPSGGLTVNLSATNSALSVPASVMVPENTNSVSFVAQTAAVPDSIDIILTASAPSLNVANTVTIDPLLSGVGFTQDSVQGGQTLQAAVFLNASAPVGGVTVQLSSDQPNVASVPASVFIPTGLSAVNFTVTTYTVSSNTTVNITSTYAGAAPIASLTVTP